MQFTSPSTRPSKAGRGAQSGGAGVRLTKWLSGGDAKVIASLEGFIPHFSPRHVVATGAAHNKFGIPIGDAPAAFDHVRALPGLAAIGVAVHIGSQLTSLGPLERAFDKVGALIADLRAAGHGIRTADLGGGLGLHYDPSAPPPPSPADYGAMVARVTRDWKVRLIFEPGRLLVGAAGVLLTEVIRVKPGAVTPFVILDAAMNDLMRPTLYDAWHGIEAVAPRGERMLADLVGPVCETGDTFARDRDVDRVEAGDLMFIRTAGAYAATMGSTYNSRPLAPEVIVSGDQWALVRARKDIEAFIRDETLPGWLSAAAIEPGDVATDLRAVAR